MPTNGRSNYQHEQIPPEPPRPRRRQDGIPIASPHPRPHRSQALFQQSPTRAHPFDSYRTPLQRWVSRWPEAHVPASGGGACRPSERPLSCSRSSSAIGASACCSSNSWNGNATRRLCGLAGKVGALRADHWAGVRRDAGPNGSAERLPGYSLTHPPNPCTVAHRESVSAVVALMVRARTGSEGASGMRLRCV
jgi:hypothetical protein